MSEPYWDGYDGPIYTGTDELPDFEIERQNKLDNATHHYLDYISRFLSMPDGSYKRYEWNIDTIMAVHDVARRVLFENHGVRVPYAAIDDKETQAS